MGNLEVPTQHAQPIKMAQGTYEFGANLISNQVLAWCGLSRTGNAAGRRHIEALLRVSAGQLHDRPSPDRWQADWKSEVCPAAAGGFWS